MGRIVYQHYDISNRIIGRHTPAAAQAYASRSAARLQVGDADAVQTCKHLICVGLSQARGSA